jgi:hypothetical protein
VIPPTAKPTTLTTRAAYGDWTRLRISPSYFGTALRQHEVERHRRIIESARPFPPAPTGFSYEDVLDLPSASGFLPLEQAAERMSTSTEEIAEMVRRGLLEADQKGKVRPAVVTVMGVETR